MLLFTIKTIKSLKKNYLLYFGMMTLLFAFEFCFIAMFDYLNQLLLDPIIFMAISFIPFMSLLISVVLSAFLSQYFIQSKQHEFSMLLMFGRKAQDLFVYLWIQFGTILLTAFIIGIGLGILLIEIINIFLANHFTFFYSIPYTIFIDIFALIFTLIIVFALSAKQLTYIDCHMMETLHQKTTQEIAPYQIFMSRHYYKRKIPFSRIFISIIEIIILFYSIDALVHNTILQNKLIHFLLCFSSIIYLSNQFIPLIFDLFYKQITHHSLLFHSLTSYMYLTHQLLSITNIHSIVLPSLFMLLMLCDPNNHITLLVVPCFIMLLILLLMCIVMKYTLYLQSLKKIYATQGALGYSIPQLFQISLLKTLFFFLSFVLIPYLYIYYLGQYIIQNQILESQMMYGLEIFYIISYLIFMVSMIYKEKQFMKEATSYVKYLNRSE